MSCVCIYGLFDDELLKDPTRKDSVLVRSSCSILAAFLIADAIIMYIHYEKTLETFLYLCHHAVSAYAYYFVISYGVFTYFANFRLMAEFSTPFVNMQWILDTMNADRKGPAFIINGLCMTFTFISARILSMPFYWHRLYQMCLTEDFYELVHMSFVLVISCLILDILNICWSTQMLRGACKVLAAKSDQKINLIQSKVKGS